MERRLAAILAADAVGYSRLIRADEEGTLAALGKLRAQIIDPKIAEHRGRIFKLMGDGLLAEFASVVDAVRAAVETQRAVSEHNRDIPADKRIDFRIGINLGDVVIDGDDIQGDGVNVAARLEGLAEPGDVCISGAVYDQVRDRLKLPFDDMGERQLKNIDRPVHVWRLPSAPTQNPADGGTAAAGAPPDKPVIAVLPFANMSADPEQEYFSDGLTEDIITALTHWRFLSVIARNSCFAYKNKAIDIKQAGRELGARYLLEGSVRKIGPRIRITAQLIDGATGHHLWAERYDRGIDDLFEVQDDIVQRIAAVVAPELVRAELKRSTDKQVRDLDAWDLCVRGMAAVRKRTRDGNAEGRELLSRAIAIRPDYADAHAGLAMSYNQDILFGAAGERTATATLAMEAARKAIECDNSSSWAHHELSTAYQWLDRADDALAEARLAVELNPNDAYGLHALGNKSDLAGDPDGIAFMEKAQKLNPEDAQLHVHLTFLARAYVNARKYAMAVERARQAIRRRSGYAPAHYILAIALAHLGAVDEAKNELAKCDGFSPGFVDSRRNWQPYADPASNERLRDGLRRIVGSA
ncbi:MAG: adenylate/guanylate cyclase domain-containing protein [Alphaproteobacteria bacterium]